MRPVRCRSLDRLSSSLGTLRLAPSPEYRLVVAGGRDEKLKATDKVALADLILSLGGKRIVEIVTGGARGIDTDVYLWARDNGYKRSPIFHADWRNILYIPGGCIKQGPHGPYNKCAGADRNAEMADYSHGVVLLPGGAGTQNMHDTAIEYGLDIWDWRDRKYGPRSQ